MVDVPLGRSDYFRNIAKEARIVARNRYFEQNPILNDGQQASMLARMGLKRWIYVGEGPIRGVYSQSGSFDDAVFVVSYDKLFRIDKDETITEIGTGFEGSSLKATVSMAATSNIGKTPEFLFIATGKELFVYAQNGYASGTISGTPANNDVIRTDLTYYKFTSGSVNAGTPAGTSANPWLVALGGVAADAWSNLAAAIGANGVPGTQYSTAVKANPSVQTVTFNATSVKVRANLVGTVGNAILTTETGASIAWTSGTLTGGGSPTLTQVDTPDDVGIISVGYVASYVVVVPVQGQGINGRFYWIEPGETTINALNFATAERAPDPISGVVVFGDQFWLPGSDTTEVWYFTGNIGAPVLRLQGIVFDRGAWEGTAVQVKESMIIVDNQGAVFQVQNGIKRISRPDIEERIRATIQYQASQIV